MSSKPPGVFISMSVPRRYVQKWAPWSMTPLRKASPWTRLPMSRPCMSVMATTIVSIFPSRTDCSSSARRGCFSPSPWPFSAPSACPEVDRGVVSWWLIRPPRGLNVEGRPGEARPALGASALVLRAGELLGGGRELAFDVGELSIGAHGPGALETRTRPAEVVDEEEGHGRHHERPRDVAARRE